MSEYPSPILTHVYLPTSVLITKSTPTARFDPAELKSRQQNGIGRQHQLFAVSRLCLAIEPNGSTAASLLRASRRPRSKAGRGRPLFWGRNHAPHNPPLHHPPHTQTHVKFYFLIASSGLRRAPNSKWRGARRSISALRNNSDTWKIATWNNQNEKIGEFRIVLLLLITFGCHNIPWRHTLHTRANRKVTCLPRVSWRKQTKTKFFQCQVGNPAPFNIISLRKTTWVSFLKYSILPSWKLDS